MPLLIFNTSLRATIVTKASSFLCLDCLKQFSKKTYSSPLTPDKFSYLTTLRISLSVYYPTLRKIFNSPKNNPLTYTSARSCQTFHSNLQWYLPLGSTPQLLVSTKLRYITPTPLSQQFPQQFLNIMLVRSTQDHPNTPRRKLHQNTPIIVFLVLLGHKYNSQISPRFSQ